MRLLKSSNFNKVSINFWEQNQHLNSLFYIDKLSLSESKPHVSLSKAGMGQQQVWKWRRLEFESLELQWRSRDVEPAKGRHDLGLSREVSVQREGAHHLPPLYTDQIPWHTMLTPGNLSLRPIVANCPEPVCHSLRFFFSLFLWIMADVLVDNRNGWD